MEKKIGSITIKPFEVYRDNENDLTMVRFRAIQIHSNGESIVSFSASLGDDIVVDTLFDNDDDK